MSKSARPPVGLSVVMAAYAVANVYPFLWMVGTSFKSRKDSFVNTALLPNDWSVDGYTVAWAELKAAPSFANSVAYSLLTLICVLAIYPMAGFVLAQHRFRGRDALFWTLISSLAVPGITLLVPTVILIARFGLMNNWIGVLLPTVCAAGPVSLYLMRNYYGLLPRELLEAATIDGASHFGAFRRVFLPLSGPALTTVSILTLVYVWNAYILPSLILNDGAHNTLPLSLFNMQATGDIGRNALMAGAVLVVIPLIAAFLALQRYYIAGLTAGVGK